MDAYIIIIISIFFIFLFIGIIFYLKTNNYFKGIQGQLGPQGKTGMDSQIQGPPGKNGEVTYNYMMNNTLWCGDSDLCIIPKNKSGIDYGNVKFYNDTTAKGNISEFKIESDNDINIVIGNTNSMSITKDKVFIAKRDILAELDDIKNFIVRTDRKYGVKSSRGGYLSDQGQAGAAWRSRPALSTDYEIMKFDEIKNT
jgi:hypothetical protein